jgi:P63C domain
MGGDELFGRAKGGAARAKALPANRRSEIAKRAAQARWGQKLIATHKGSFKQDFGINVDCYVLNDEGKTAVISQRGMGETLGLGSSGSRLPRFVSGKAISRHVGPELREKLDKPVIFQAQVGGPETLSQVHGYDVTILIDLCKAIIEAESNKQLMPHQTNVAAQAHVIVNACAKYGIQDLVYKLAGYNSTREEAVAAFKFYVQSEARDYEREFPNQLYKEWYRLYHIQEPERGKAWKFKHLTVNHVWFPLARSHGRILDLTRAQKEASQERHKKLHQFLSIIGVKALRTHLGRLLGIAETSESQEEYERHVRRIFGDQLEFEV